MSEYSPERLFSTGDLTEFLDVRHREMLAAVEDIPADAFLNAPAADLAERFSTRHSCAPVLLRPDETTVDQVEMSMSIDEIPDGRFMFAESDTTITGTLVTFHVPFSGAAELLQLRGSTWSTSMPRAHVGDAELVFAYKSHAPDVNQLRNNYQRALQQTQDLVRDSSRVVTEFNQKLVGAARMAIDARRDKILKARNTVGALGFPMRRRPDSPMTYSVPATRKKIATRRPPVTTTQFRPEPVLDSKDYEDILRVVQSMALVLERSPAAFRTLGEEELRVHFLVQLNGQFEGAATGETFNAGGKTDILIRVEDKNIFIAECKFWRGPAGFTATIDQLLGYLSWRDTKTAILVFNRDVAMSTVLAQIPDLLKSHTGFKHHVVTEGETRFRATFRQSGDRDREVIVTVLVFDVPGV